MVIPYKSLSRESSSDKLSDSRENGYIDPAQGDPDRVVQHLLKLKVFTSLPPTIYTESTLRAPKFYLINTSVFKSGIFTLH